jgi:hypothetical protein
MQLLGSNNGGAMRFGSSQMSDECAASVSVPHKRNNRLCPSTYIYYICDIVLRLLAGERRSFNMFNQLEFRMIDLLITLILCVS